MHHALLGLAVAAQAGAALRLAALTGARGLDRVLAAAALAACAAVLWVLVLGVAGLGAEPVALVGAACATWGATRAWLPAPSPPGTAELAQWWAGLTPAGRALVGALAGGLAAYALFLLRFPLLGDDGRSYHLPDIAGWVQSGHPGAAVDYFDDLPTGSYPIANELLLTWPVAISRGLVPLSLWPVATLGLTALAGWRALRLFHIHPAVCALAVAALLSSPVVVGQMTGPNTDLPALAWLVVTGALCVASRDRPALLAPAIVAAGLAVGTKTTPLAPATFALAAAAWAGRAQLRPLARPLGLAALAAAVVGAGWAARNLAEHGSPLWPLVASSFGDPLPPVLREIDGRLIADLGSIGPRADSYFESLAGGITLMVGVALAAALARSRAVTAAALAAAACVVVWAAAPYTGYPRDPVYDVLAGGAVRYLLPSLAVCGFALALATRRGHAWARAAASVALGAALVLNAQRVLELDFPLRPSVGLIAAGVLAGGAAAVAAGLVTLPALPRWALAVGAVALACALAIPASGYVERHLRVATDDEAARFIASRPSFADGDTPISYLGAVNGALVGDRLRHPVRLLPRDETCGRLRRRISEEWVVMLQPVVSPYDPGAASRRRSERLRRCLAPVPPAFAEPLRVVYGDH